tara:strand:- start:1487 stop:2863 length:1377 start_codon:yes stop_codon:yes gene_type:complete
MFKKIEIWVLYLVLVLVFISYIVFGAMVIREHDGGHHIPIITPISKIAHFMSLIPRNFIRMGEHSVRSPNQVRGNRFEGQYGFIGDVNKYEKYLILARYEGGLEESVVELIDLQSFNVLHTWNPDINSFFEDIDKTEEWVNIMRDLNDSRYKMYHPIFFGDGSLLFQNNSPLIKIDKHSNLEWIKDDETYHHSIEQDSEGNFWVCVCYYPYKIDSVYVGNKLGNYSDDGIRKLSPTGEILFDKSISEIFIENDMEYLLFSVGDRVFTQDPIHLNDIQPVEKDTKYWKKGDVFISLRHQSMIILYRPKTDKIIWQSTGQFYNQHDVDILDVSRISVFDNNSKDTYYGNVVDGNNRVVIYDFETGEYSYYLNESLKTEDVRTVTEGTSQILPNGDLFIEESNYGRTLYFNSDGSLRWKHINRSNNGKLYSVSWSRILYSKDDIENVHKFLKIKDVDANNE